jgi:hypothetical protein
VAALLSENLRLMRLQARDNPHDRADGTVSIETWRRDRQSVSKTAPSTRLK